MTRLISEGRSTFNYPDRGATARRPLPAGYNLTHHRTRIGSGRAVLEAAGAAVTTFRAHRSSGMLVTAGAGPVRPGDRVVVGIGVGPLWIDAPCEVIWTAYEPRRVGFAYGTLTGHPESGEESFVVDMEEDGSVWFEVTAFSRPGSWYTRIGGPVIPFLQLRYARRLGRYVRRLAVGARPAGYWRGWTGSRRPDTGWGG
ncbi:DUF1990 domain-containing protein [Streptomyces sp. ISL-43]|uniref:DUF1990 family protein n=1 Tax=Streptomyces sp. ISL-43 TaxID=2819183 RepID=UPI001BEC255B|nr:DUF1990 domain-containing protein [Streptomyces sp. ISL-43]MBT2450532.1 DUF1990 domain-containing protein [Streptomyces sp. ISL-43]